MDFLTNLTSRPRKVDKERTASQCLGDMLVAGYIDVYEFLECLDNLQDLDAPATKSRMLHAAPRPVRQEAQHYRVESAAAIAAMIEQENLAIRQAAYRAVNPRAAEQHHRNLMKS